MNDITALTEREKFEAWAEKAGELLWGRLKNQRNKSGGYSLQVYTHMWNAWQAANVEMVEALEKAQQSVELVDLQRDKIKRLESDLWDKEQLRKVHSEKSFELEGKVRELEARNQKDFVWRGKEISRLNDEVDELKERLESRTVTVKLPMPYDINVAGERVDWEKGDHFDRDEVIAALAEAGINAEAE